MNILVVCQYYYPEQFKINEICEQLVKEGHQVMVLTGLPNYPTGTIPEAYRNGKRRAEMINGVEVIRTFEIGRKPGVIGMALNYASFLVSASLKAFFIKKDFDLIFSYQLSPVSMVMPAVILKKRTSKPLYLYCCDLWPESMKNIIADEKSLIFKFVNKFSTYLYRQCDAITVTSRPFIKYFTEVHKIPEEKLSYIPQHAESIEIATRPVRNDGCTHFVFTGNIGISQDMDCVLHAVERLKHIPGFHVHVVGDGSYAEKSRQIVKEKLLEELVTFHGRHPLEKMPDFYQLADACLLTLKADSIVGLTMPSKLQGYMAAGKPVIGAINGAAQEVIREANCGICVNAGDAVALAEAMKSFIEQPERYKDCGQNGRNYFDQHFTKTMFMQKLTHELMKLLGGT